MSSSSPHPPTPQGPGSVFQAPNLPTGFTDTFTSRYVDTDGLRLHAVTGGEGPALLLVCGWPQTWYAWRLLMPALAQDFQVVAVDPRGVGLSDKPLDGYDTGTLASDLVALMAALGHHRFAMVGHDIGMWTGYALAADHPNHLDRLAVAEATVPGLSPSPPLLGSTQSNDRLWHFAFNRLSEVNEQLVKGREHLYFGHQFATKAARKLPDYAVRHYIDTLACDPEALRASFAFYRALDATIAQNQQRRTRQLTLPVLTIAGAQNSGELVGNTMKLAAHDVESLIIDNCGHYPAEETPEDMLAALTTFLAPYRHQDNHDTALR
ncbi:alpha/beta fold hydrolase [Streptantibioticus ferralitis]|uniref:Alpha/beta hydrolase n=1 Tax=Streptantibioticus ferralitis TaxID=236510 RepID=A0ABT5ZC52_9ACTN|nr:alpha/beta hydrolase [Streptantibioticus ferralitis]MDF2261409.1 alpha/beta hydrolase [Streptantibioticus ferralitis]